MASHNSIRKLVLSASCRPLRSSHLLRMNSMSTPRSEVNAGNTSADQTRVLDNKESEIEKRDEGALYGESNSPLRVFDLMDSVFPTRNLRSMIDTMDRIFDDPFFAPLAVREAPFKRSIRTPWDFKETDDAFKLRLDMPGMGKEEVKVYVEDDCLVIKGEHSAESKSEEEQWTSRRHGSYSTRILLPDVANSEQIRAELKNGVLNVTVPKLKEEERKKNVIDVHVE